MKGLRTILLVEDNPNDAELTRVALQEHNLANDLVWVEDGADALDYLHRRKAWADREGSNPILILLDLKLPLVDGLEVLQAVKGDTKLRTIPIVIMTTSREESDLQHTYDIGANAYVVKPVEFKQFVSAVKGIGTFWALVNEPSPG